MMRRFFLTLAVMVIALASAFGRAEAQTDPKWKGDGYLHVDGGAQATSSSFTSTVTFKLTGEDASITSDYKLATGPVFMGRGGVRVWRNLAIGVGVTRFTRMGTASISGQMPHPLHFNQPRSLTGSATGLQREETMGALEFSWLFRASKKLDIMIFGGPAWFNANQDMVTMVHFTETYPYDTVNFIGADTKTVQKTALGFTLGADFSYMFTKSMGLGGIIRYSGASASFSPVAGSASDVTLGGAQAGLGLRIRF